MTPQNLFRKETPFLSGTVRCRICRRFPQQIPASIEQARDHAILCALKTAACSLGMPRPEASRNRMDEKSPWERRLTLYAHGTDNDEDDLGILDLPGGITNVQFLL